MKEHCKPDAKSRGYLEHAMEEMNFSASTLADLGGSEDIRATDIPDTIPYRSLDQRLFS